MPFCEEIIRKGLVQWSIVMVKGNKAQLILADAIEWTILGQAIFSFSHNDGLQL